MVWDLPHFQTRLRQLHHLQHYTHIDSNTSQQKHHDKPTMTAVRGPYNKSSQRIPLTDDQLETLAKGFIEHRKTVPYPHCKIPTVFRTEVF
ncbi:hypothetical protein G6F43_013481 [Rhizopus delemar]|nr:hypothetical protein G6F43_013481 [Rhizopus delemar]